MTFIENYVKNTLEAPEDFYFVRGLISVIRELPVYSMIFKGAERLMTELEKCIGSGISTERPVILAYLKSNIFDVPSFAVNIHLADHCNLSCAHCSHVSPFAGKHVYDSDAVLEDCKTARRLFEGCVRPVRISLTGGEPLLHPDIVNILKRASAIPGKIQYTLTTNALLWHKDDKPLIEALRSFGDRLLVALSDYGEPNHDKVLSVADRLAECRVPYSIDDHTTFYDCRMHRKPYGNSLERLKCRLWGWRCLEICDGQYYPCTFNFHVRKLGDAFPSFSVPVADLENGAEALFLAVMPQPLCGHCRAAEWGKVPWGRSSRALSEWVE